MIEDKIALAMNQRGYIEAARAFLLRCDVGFYSPARLAELAHYWKVK